MSTKAPPPPGKTLRTLADAKPTGINAIVIGIDTSSLFKNRPLLQDRPMTANEARNLIENLPNVELTLIVSDKPDKARQVREHVRAAGITVHNERVHAKQASQLYEWHSGIAFLDITEQGFMFYEPSVRSPEEK